MFPSASSPSYLDSDQALPRRFRLGTPRVRSGCLSCKARRIKCDEGKPSCERCIKSRRQCEYPVPKVPKGPRKKTFPDTSRLLVPKTPEVQKQFFIPVLWQAPRDARFENDLEFRYYQTFREKTVVDLAGFEDLDVWSRLVLQACDNVLSIRNAVIAIGALDQTLDAAQSRERRASFDLSATAGHVTSHHHFALEQYDKAIKRMREDAMEGGQDLRTTLISCLLIVTFELFHGNHNSALKQASIGMNMIMDRMRQCNEENDNPSSRARSLFDSVEEALIQKFVRLDLSSMAFVDESLLRAHGTSQSETIEAYETMPTTFSSLSEAQKYWELSMRRIMNFMTVTSNWEYTSRIEDPPALQGLQMMANEKLVSESPQSQSFQTLRKILSATSAASDDPPKVDSATKRVSDWQNAFQPLFRLSRTASGSSDFLRATMLQIRYNATLLSTSTSPFEGELQYDKYASNFQEIIDLSRIIIGEYAQNDQQTTWSSKASFTFDVGPIGPLYIVATKCRNPVMRREAISILLAKPKRECIWDNVVAAKFATVVMNIEEQGLQGTFVPERSRIRGEGLTFNFLQRKGRLRYSSGHWCPPGHRRIKTAEVSW